VLHGCRVLDADSHVMEPDDLFDHYLEARWRDRAPRTRRMTVDWPYFADIEVLGHRWPASIRFDQVRFLDDGHGGRLTYTEAYRDYVAGAWEPASYLLYMDRAGIDHMVLYPTLTLHSTAVPEIEPDAAAAVRRAYNSWLADFCAKGDGRLHGVGMLDLRDVDLACAEAERCVRDLGLVSVGIIPDPPVEGRPLDDPHHDPLWATVAALGVPLGTHEAMYHRMGDVGYVGARHLTGTTVPWAPLAVSFGLGEMLAAVAFTGAICARHPGLRVVFTESSAGWPATWLPFLDEKWERARLTGFPMPTEHEPSWYFRRQCSISGEAGERGYACAADAGFADCLLAATDFPHPEDERFPATVERFFGDGAPPLADDDRRKLLWDNGARLYGLA
jgi:predicted TIM-barrel fold metal-dependent hydrolase